MRIVLGSENKDKIKITEDALKDLHLKVEVKGVKVDSETNQSLDKETTTKNAIDNARNAKKVDPDADFWIGLENGLQDHGEGDHLVTIACLMDKNGDEYIDEGEEIHLPEEVLEKVKKGEWFGDVIKEYAKDHEIDENLVKLSPFTRAVQSAYVGYMKKTTEFKFRQRSAAVIIDEEENFLIVQLTKYGEDDWNFSGGGIEEGENAEQAILRELKEELGTDEFKVLKESKHKEQYDWPNWLIAGDISKERPNIYRGQEVTYFLVSFVGKKEDLKFDPNEIRKIKWVKYGEIKDHFHFARQEKVLEEVVDELLA